MSALPKPMLAHSGPLPERDGYALELKWDGFRALVRCGDEFRVRKPGGLEHDRARPGARGSAPVGKRPSPASSYTVTRPIRKLQ